MSMGIFAGLKAILGNSAGIRQQQNDTQTSIEGGEYVPCSV